MAEEIKDLIEKIRQEGIEVAEQKARAIEEEAKRRASVIVEEAKKEAGKIIAEAEDKTSKMLESSNVSLKQAGRDLLLSLKKEINVMLGKLVLARLQESLSPDELVKIITALIKGSESKGKENIIISLNKDDLESLEKGFLSELQVQIKKGITLRPSEDIRAGFIISYDAGKSYFDFSDKAIAEYIGSYLRPRLQDILKVADST